MEIVMITDYRGFLRQRETRGTSMDKEMIRKIFARHGVKVVEYTYEEVANTNCRLSGKHIIYSSSQDPKYKMYIDDILYALSDSNVLIPRYEIFRAHENKGFQEIIKRKVGIRSLNCLYFGNWSGFEKNCHLVQSYPMVLKKTSGAGSSNVFKVASHNEVTKSIRKMNRPPNYMIKTLRIAARQKLLGRGPGDDNYAGPFVLQEFMEGLDHDWKVLVFGPKYYVLNRAVREHDFRASGSGRFSYVDPPLEILHYSRHIFRKLDVPFASLDIGHHRGVCNLIEFQGTHFGPYTIMNSNCHFRFVDGKWKKNEGKSLLEEEYVQSVVGYIRDRYCDDLGRDGHECF